MYEKSIRLYEGLYVVRVRYPDGSRVSCWCLTFGDARKCYDSLKPEVGDRPGFDSCIRCDVPYPDEVFVCQ